MRVILESKSYIATPPGATIKEQLDDYGMTQKEFAVLLLLTYNAERTVAGQDILREVWYRFVSQGGDDNGKRTAQGAV